MRRQFHPYEKQENIFGIQIPDGEEGEKREWELNKLLEKVFDETKP